MAKAAKKSVKKKSGKKKPTKQSAIKKVAKKKTAITKTAKPTSRNTLSRPAPKPAATIAAVYVPAAPRPVVVPGAWPFPMASKPS